MRRQRAYARAPTGCARPHAPALPQLLAPGDRGFSHARCDLPATWGPAALGGSMFVLLGGQVGDGGQADVLRPVVIDAGTVVPCAGSDPRSSLPVAVSFP